jgi:GGDEF domain-containing protein
VRERFASNIRNSDIVALAGKNRIVGIFPMTTPDEARLAFKRHLRSINTRPFKINGFPVAVQVAGSVINFDAKRTPTTSIFLRVLLDELSVMIHRIKNIHGLA